MRQFPILNIPFANLRLKKEDEIIKVYDIIRKKWIILTPEEWVRQNFVHWLIKSKHYPASHIGNEVSLKVNNVIRRCDTIIYGNVIENPLIIIEYKAPSISINQIVFDQIVKYNMGLKAKYLIVSNGLNHYCCVIDYLNNTYNFIPEIPDYQTSLAQFSEN